MEPCRVATRRWCWMHTPNNERAQGFPWLSWHLLKLGCMNAASPIPLGPCSVLNPPAVTCDAYQEALHELLPGLVLSLVLAQGWLLGSQMGQVLEGVGLNRSLSSQTKPTKPKIKETRAKGEGPEWWNSPCANGTVGTATLLVLVQRGWLGFHGSALYWPDSWETAQ